MKGYANNILYINLSTGKTKTEPLGKEMARNFLGGAGFGIKMITDHQRPTTDAFDPENPIVYSCGTFSGMMVAGSGSKWGVAAKSPQSQGLGEAYSTGFFGAELRRAGYDIVMVTGKAERPSYIYLEDDSVQILDANHLWGKHNWDTEDTIKSELGDPGVRVASIGPAGENLVRFSAIINDRLRAAGRTGMGAVMGSKNLKAVAVRGFNDVEVADVDGFKEFALEIYEKSKGPATEKYRLLGTAANVLTLNKQAAMPTRNWQDAVFEKADKISGEALNEMHVEKIQGCDSCGMRCEHVGVVREGPFKGAIGRVEYEPSYAFGSCTGVDRPDAIIRAVQLSDLYGTDALSTGVVVAFAMEAYEKGIISKKDTGGIELEFGNAEGMCDMIEKIALREDIGDLLAEGVERAAAKLGKGAEKFAMHIKGVEMTGYDVRGLKTCALGYAVSRRGADHQRHGAYGPDLKGQVDRFKAEKGRGQLVIDGEDLYSVIDSLIICKFSRGIWDYDSYAKMYTLATGIPMTAEEMRRCGERISNLGKIYNLREGIGRERDTLPIRCMTEPIKSGIAKGSLVTREELDLLLDDYYETRGWSKDGIPSDAKLKELGLEDYAEHLRGLKRTDTKRKSGKKKTTKKMTKKD